ncbi:MAG: hypothetical protein GX823_02060, partial [Clostridiales bacterium]|nr:hypothetical protein [Clostridiales bacterium]
AEAYAEGEPRSVWLQLDFGQSGYDDWTLDCYVHTPHDACGLGAIWSYSDTDGTAVNEITFTAGDSGFNDTIVLCSQWEAQSGSFSLRLSGVPGTYGRSNNFYFAIQGTLIYDDDGFSLALDTTPQLRLGITGAADCSIAQAEFINLDEWDRDTLVHFERALLKLYASIYSYPSIL